MSLDSVALTEPTSDVGAWTVQDVYVESRPFLWRALQRLGVPEPDLDDCLQEVLLVVHRRLHTFDPARAKLTTWLFGICLRIVKRHRRRFAARREVPVAQAPDAVAPRTPEDELDRAQTRQTLERILATMDVEKRATLVLFELEGLKTEAIAELMEVPLGTVHSRLHAARKQLLHKLTLERRRRPGFAWGLAIGASPGSLRELLGALPPLRPMPRAVHLRALARASELASGQGASLLSLLGGKGVLAWMPAGVLAAAAVGSAGLGPRSVAGTMDRPPPALAATAPAAPREVTPDVTPGSAPGQPGREDGSTRRAHSAATVAATDSPGQGPAISTRIRSSLPPTTVAGRPIATPRVVAPSRPSGVALGGDRTLAAESQLVEAATRSLKTEPAAALAQSREYSARFTAGQLRFANEFVAIDALVRLGRHDEAQRRAAALAVADPGGLYSRAALERAGSQAPRRAPVE